MLLETHDHHLAHPSRHANELVGGASASGINHQHRQPVLEDALTVLVDDLQETRGALQILSEEAERTSWRELWLESVAKSKGSLVVDGKEYKQTIHVVGDPNVPEAFRLSEEEEEEWERDQKDYRRKFQKDD